MRQLLMFGGLGLAIVFFIFLLPNWYIVINYIFVGIGAVCFVWGLTTPPKKNEKSEIKK